MTGFLLFLLGLGLFAYAWCRLGPREPRANGRLLDGVVEGVLFGFILWALASFMLAKVGLFSSVLISGGLLAASLGWLGLARLRGLPSGVASPDEAGPGRDLLSPIALGLIIAASVYYVSLPTYYLLGGRDPGIYLDVAAHISRTGGMSFSDPLLPELKEILGGGLRLGYPAFTSAYDLGLSADPGQLQVQFTHLFSAVAAHGFSWFGIEGVVRANGLVGGLAALAFFALGRRLFGPKVSLWAVAFLLVSPAVVWNNRITMSEPTLLLLTFSGLYVLVRAVGTNSALWGGAAGVILGAGVLARLDGGFSVLAIFGVSLWSALFGRRARLVALAALGGYALFFFAGLVDVYRNSYWYFDYLMWKKGQLDKLLYFIVVALVGSVLLVALDARRIEVREATLQRVRPWLHAAVAVALLFLFAFSFGVRPKLNPLFSGRSMVEFCWYITPAFPVLAIFGLGFLLRDRLEPSFLGEWLPFVLLVLGTTAIYVWRPSIRADHIWASRRWVPYVIPGLLLLGTYGFFRLTEVYLRPSLGRLAVVGLGAYYALSVSFLLAPFATRSMLAEYPSAYAAMTERLPPRSLILVNDGWTPSVLKWVYGRDAYMVKWGGLPPGSIARLLRRFEDRPVFAMGNLQGFPFSPEVGLEEVPGLVLSGQYPEAVIGTFSRKLDVLRFEYPLVRLNTSGTFRLRAGGPVMSTRVGKRVEGEIVSQGVVGNLVFGPYVPMKEGRYRVVWKGEVVDRAGLGSLNGPDRRRVAHIDVVAGKGTVPLGLRYIYGEDLPQGSGDTAGFSLSMTAALQKPYDDVEFRFYLDEPISIKVSEVLVEHFEEHPQLGGRSGGRP